MYSILEQEVKNVMNNHPLYGSVFYNHGIAYFDYMDHTILEMCRVKGINQAQMLEAIETLENDTPCIDRLRNCDIPELIAYLHHVHMGFINRKMPYFTDLVQRIAEKPVGIAASLAEDLSVVMPVFVEDFAQHIYEEENTFFQYIYNLLELSEKQNASKVIYVTSKYSISSFAFEHLEEDELNGLRSITNNYYSDENSTIEHKILMAELKQFDLQLQFHAEVENKILFPKAFRLEQQLIKQSTTHTNYN